MHDHGGFFLMGTPKQGQSLEEVRSLMLAEGGMLELEMGSEPSAWGTLAKNCP